MEKDDKKSKVDKDLKESIINNTSNPDLKQVAKVDKESKIVEKKDLKNIKPREKKNPSDVEIVETDEINDYYDLVDFNWESTSYNTTISKKYASKKKYEMPNPKLIRAFIPGVIQKIFVTDGNKVKQNDILLVLEAMKMKNNLLAPLNGIIKKVYVKQGAQVTKNEILIEFK